MKTGLRSFLAAIITAILLCTAAMPASAAEQTQAAAAQSQDSGTIFWTPHVLPDAVGRKRVTAITHLSDEEVEAISDRLSEHSDVYLVELQDGRRTYYMTVDFRDDDSIYFSKLVVMRATSHKLYDRSAAMAAADDGQPAPVLMSYSHIIGELSLHYVTYRVTDALGGEKLPWLLGRLYRKCVVADLNIDESRMAAAIRLAGNLLG